MIFILYFCLLAESESSGTELKELNVEFKELHVKELHVEQLYNEHSYQNVMNKLAAFEQMLARLEESVSKIQVIFNTILLLN